jgi:hypothetical protein
MDLLGYNQTFFAFGHSVFENTPGYSASFIGNKYLFFYEVGDEKYMLTWQDEQVTGIYNVKDQLQVENLLDNKVLSQSILTELKAIKKNDDAKKNSVHH